MIARRRRSSFRHDAEAPSGHDALSATGPGRTRLARTTSFGSTIVRVLLGGLLGIASTAPAGAARPRVYAIVGARVVTAPGRVLDSATIVLRDGLIERVGADLPAPADAEIVEGKGLTVYAGLIEPFSRLGMPKAAEAEREGGRGAGREAAQSLEKAAERGPGRPNLQVRADARAALLYQAPPAAELEKMRKLGFTSALAVPDSGVFRGTSALVHLGGDDPARAVLVPDVAAHAAFETAPGDVYPDSLMGVIALLRQTFADASRHETWKDRWRRSPQGLERPPLSPVLDAVAAIAGGKTRIVFEADDTHAFARIAALGSEFSLAPIVVGNGSEYELIDELRRTPFPLIVPVAFPEAPHLEEQDSAIDVTLRALRHWERAPGNLAALHAAGIPFSLTTYRLKNASDFRKNVARAIAKGLPADEALRAVTTEPARVLGVGDVLGTIDAGKIADLVLTDGPLFSEKTQIKRLFIDGQPIDVEEESKDFDPNARIDPRGTWEISYTVRGETLRRSWKIEGSPESLSGTGETQAGKVPLVGLSLTGNRLTGSYAAGSGGSVEFKWIIKGDEVSGAITLPNGQKISLSGKRTAKPEGSLL